MQLSEALRLIQCPELTKAGRWADLGCGSGLFTQALAELLPAGSEIYALDKDLNSFSADAPEGRAVRPVQADFLQFPLPVPPLDGILMANALHYVSEQTNFLRQLQPYLKPYACFLIVEYDTDQALPPWVPYPLSFHTLHQLFSSAGYPHIQKLATRPSRYGRSPLYAAYIFR